MYFSAVARRTASLFILFSLVNANGRDQQPTRPGDPSVVGDISNFGNTRYTAALTIGGKTVNVILDTGSTDLWMNPGGGVGAFESTGVKKKISYGQGDSFVNGTIGLAEMTIAGHTIPKQAFLNVTEISAGMDSCGRGICGLVGLGFDNPNVGFERALSDAGLDGPKIGKSVLTSIFDANPSKGRFFALSLSRIGDTEDSADASLSIQEYEERYANVQWMARRYVHPPTETNWRVLFDGVTVNGQAIPWTANSKETPSKQLVVLVDSGTTNFLVRPEVRERIYSAVPGAVLAKNSSLQNTYWSADKDVWVIPCDTAVSMSAVFGGQPYPVHPLDMTTVRTQKGPDGVTYTYCVGSVTNGGTIATGTTDAVFGDSFMRNVYTSFNFGDNTTSPYIQFLSQTNEWEGTQDFAHVRKNQLGNSPHEVSPAELVKIFDGVEVAPVTANKDSECTTAANSNKVQAVAGNLASESSDAGFSTSKYLPIILGLLVANLAVVLGLAVLALFTQVRKGTAHRGRYVTTNTNDDAFRVSFAEDKPYSDR
ncbi:Six-hairpin glycosidase [Favolaschia claudopus]|uniref:Six-hairpin glycosidase n=1 Tax=Favolaschia claudopus TaxID=2862362 RepID=A0AAW0BET3_9AGAR